MREHINYSVDKSLNLITNEYKRDKVKTKMTQDKGDFIWK